MKGSTVFIQIIARIIAVASLHIFLVFGCIVCASARACPRATATMPCAGDWQGFRDCHIETDLVLIYRQTEQALELVRIGSYAEWFG